MAKNDRHDVFVVQEGKDGQNYWKEVGVAFENSDGSLSVRLHVLPGTTMQVRKHVAREDREEQPRQAQRSQSSERTGRGGRR